MDAAPVLFGAGVVLGLCCNFRLVVRAFQWMEAIRPSQRPAWDPTHLILGIQLRNTLWLELVGYGVAILMIVAAIQSLRSSG